MDKKTINTIIIIGGVAVAGYFLFGKKLFGKSAQEPVSDGSEEESDSEGDSESFSANGESQSAMRVRRNPSKMEDEVSDIDNIGNHKFMKKRKPRTHKEMCINAVSKKLNVSRVMAIQLLKRKDPNAMRAIEDLRKAYMKTRTRKAKSLNNDSAVTNMQSTEEGSFAFNAFDEID